MIALLFAVLVAEIGLRICGFQPYELPKFTFESSPTNCFGKDSLGLILQPGSFDVNIGHGLKYHVVHGLDSNRITSNSTEVDPGKDRMEVYGCSYSYGQGVDDEQSYPFLLQSRFPSFKVTNHSVPGYGTLQAYLKIKGAFESGSRPRVIILNHAYFHEERNLLSKRYMSRLYDGFQVLKAQKTHAVEWSEMIYPYIELDKDSFRIGYKNVIKEFRHLPLVEYSSLINMMDKFWIDRRSQDAVELKSSKLLIEKINDLCRKYHCTFIVAEVDVYQKKRNMIAEFCRSKQMNYVNICPDFVEGDFRISQYDIHPNVAAHRFYAERMSEYLDEIGIN